MVSSDRIVERLSNCILAATQEIVGERPELLQSDPQFRYMNFMYSLESNNVTQDSGFSTEKKKNHRLHRVDHEVAGIFARNRNQKPEN